MRNQYWKLFIEASNLLIYYLMVTLILRSRTLVWASFMKRRISTSAPEFLKPCELPFFFERCYVYNIFITNHRWLVVIGSNFKLTLRLLFFPTITTSNNLPFMICCKNVVDILFLFFFCSLFTIFCLSFFFSYSFLFHHLCRSWLWIHLNGYWSYSL